LNGRTARLHLKRLQEPVRRRLAELLDAPQLQGKDVENNTGRRPVYVMKADGSDPHAIEVLHSHGTIDDNRAG
jgi:hypothetical protein